MPGKPVAHVKSIVKGGLVATGSGSVFVGDVGIGHADTCLSCRPTTGSPVNPILGSKVLPPEIDFALPAPSVFAFARSYNSGDARCGPLGHGWSIPGVSMSIECSAKSTVLIDPEGRRIRFQALVPGQALFSASETLWVRRGGPTIPLAHPPSELPQRTQGPGSSVLEAWAGRWANVPAALQHDPRVILVQGGGVGGYLAFRPANPWACSTLPPQDPQVQRWRLTEAIDVAGYTTRYEWSGGDHGLLNGVQDSAGRLYHFAYAQLPQALGEDLVRLQGVILRRSAEGGRGLNARQLKEADWLVRFDYDQWGDLQAVRNRTGEVVRQFTWTHEHLMASHSQPGGIHASYEWAHAGNSALPARPGRQARVVCQSESDGLVRQYLYLEDRTMVRDNLGRLETYHFRGEGGQKRWTGHTQAEVDGHRAHISMEYDSFGRQTGSTDALGRKTQVRRDGLGRAVGLTGPDGGSSVVTLDEHSDLPVKVQDPDGRTTTIDRDTRGNPVCVTLPDGRATRYRYEHARLPDRPSHIVDALGKARTLQYNHLGQLTQHTDCSGHSQAWTYDDEGRLLRTVNALGEATQIQYDALGRPTLQFHADGSSVHTEWDLLGRQVRVVSTGAPPPAALEGHAPPQPAGPQRVLQYQWDHFGRLIGKMDAAGRLLRLRYDAAGRLVQLQNENEAAAEFQYDALDRLIQETGFDGRVQRYRYNPAGELIEKLEGTPQAPQVTRYAYDSAGRVKSVSRLGEAAAGGQGPWHSDTFEWSRTGQLLSARSAASTVNLSYDAAGNLAQEVQTHADGWRYQVQHRHHLQEQQHLSTYGDLPALHWLTYGPGHLHGLRWEMGLAEGRGGEGGGPTAITLDFERDALHRETSRSCGGAAGRFTQHRTYDAAGRLLGARTQFAGQPAAQEPGSAAPASTAQPLVGGPCAWSRHYQCDALGQLVGILDEATGGFQRPAGPGAAAAPALTHINYRYDAGGRLVWSQHRPSDGTSVQNTYRFDPAGNRLSVDTAQAVGQPLVSDNRVLQLDGVACQYDAAGNLVAKRWPDGARLALAYDGAHRLTELQHTSADGRITQARYEYDAFSRRVAKHVHTRSNGRARTATTRFGWDGERLVHEEAERPTGDGPRRLRRTTVYEPGSFVPLLRVERLSDAPPAPAQSPATEQEAQAWAQMTGLLQRQGIALPDALQDKVASTQVSVFHTDHLGTPLRLTDTQGNTLWQAQNDDWGAVRNESGSTDQPIRFQGQWVDEESGFYYNRHRYYDPTLSAYITHDPIGLSGGINKYTYSESNPILKIDPFGLFMILLGRTFSVPFLGGWSPSLGVSYNNGEWDMGYLGSNDIIGVDYLRMFAKASLIDITFSTGDFCTNHGELSQSLKAGRPLPIIGGIGGNIAWDSKNNFNSATLSIGPQIGASFSGQETRTFSLRKDVFPAYEKLKEQIKSW
jgi:RHS repeat-associated protein